MTRTGGQILIDILKANSATGISGIAGLEVARPDGAIYVMPHCGGLIGRKRPNGRVMETSTDLASYFLDDGVIVAPGAGFFRAPCLRMSVATSAENIRDGIRRIEAACMALSRKSTS
jgi:aspartate aminotransferase